MNDFKGALRLLQNLSEEELERAEIYQFIPICEEFSKKKKGQPVLAPDDLFDLVRQVKKHERVRWWFLAHTFNYYLRKCNSDKQILGLVEVMINADLEKKEIGAQVSMNYGLKTLFFTNAEKMTKLPSANAVEALKIEALDLRGTTVKKLTLGPNEQIKRVDLRGLEIEDLRPLSYLKALEEVFVDENRDYTGINRLRKKNVRLNYSK